MKYILFLFLALSFSANAQLKFIIEDFEGFADGNTDLGPNGVFVFGNMHAGIETQKPVHKSYSGDRDICISKKGKEEFGGWGKGVGLNVELDPYKDRLDFYVYQSVPGDTGTVKIELQEDDNGDNVFQKEMDDTWAYKYKLDGKNNWELVSIPLSAFRDDNYGGDGVFNISYREGRLLCFIMTFQNAGGYKDEESWYFDFICFSQGKLPVGSALFDAPVASPGDYCSLGAWSKEGNMANFTDIASAFEKSFKPEWDKNLGVVHFFQPFAFDGGDQQNLYPSVERINKVIQQGYMPMITLEDHFVNSKSTLKQPNLYSIVEGHFDNFFTEWAKQIKQVKGTVLLRILHEFNGDWYPWCIVNNDKNPQLLITAFRRIHDIFTAQDVKNVKFIWCPNSMSWPQENWNFIMNAYPGDDYVDYVGLDIYNGAGKDISVWRSFRKEGIENYFILTQRLPSKPLFVCETASRERENFEPSASQDKAGWIKQTSEALCTDMSGVRLLAWFNEKKTFRIDTSPASKTAYLEYILKNDHFKPGTKYIPQLVGR